MQKKSRKIFSNIFHSLLSFFLISCLFGMTGCVSQIRQDSADSGKYSTQNPKTALEYSVFLSKQVNICTSQLETRMQMANQVTQKKAQAKAEYISAGDSLRILQKTLNTVKVTMPSDGREEDQKSLVMAIEKAISHLNSYRSALKSGKSVSGYIETFHNDFIQITGLADNYQE